MDTLDLAKELIRHETTSPVTDPKIITYIRGILEAERIDAEVHERNGVYSLTAETGDSDTHVCLNGHVDVVPPGNGWDITEPFKPVVQDGKLYGRGAADMKGGLAAQIMAFIDLHNDDDFDGTATLMVVGDEEVGGFDGTEYLLQRYADDAFDYAIIGEPTDCDIQVGVRGIIWADIYIDGEAIHASRPHMAHNRIEDLPVILDRLNNIELTHELDPELPDVTAPVTIVQTNGPQNSLPGEIRIGMDIRYLPGMTKAQIREDIDTALDGLDIEYTVTMTNHGAAFKLTDERFKEIATECVTEVMGRTPHHVTDGGSSDGRFFAGKGTPFIELGPNQTPGHQPDEWCRIEHLEELREAYRKMTKRLADEKTLSIR